MAISSSSSSSSSDNKSLYNLGYLDMKRMKWLGVDKYEFQKPIDLKGSIDEDFTSANDRSSKAEGYKVVPPPITGNFLTPRADHIFCRPKSVNESVVSNPKIFRDSVIIEDWNSDDEEEGEIQNLVTQDHTECVNSWFDLAYELATKSVSFRLWIDSMEACGFWKARQAVVGRKRGANAGESSFVYLGGKKGRKIHIDAYNLPNADLPLISIFCLTWKLASDTLPDDVADFINMDNTIAISPIPTLKINKDHPKGQILGDPTSAIQTRGKIQKASSAQQALDDHKAPLLVYIKLQTCMRPRFLPFYNGNGFWRGSMCQNLKECLHKRLQMSFHGKNSLFFLGLDRTATAPIESNKPMVKDEDGVDVDVHVYMSMIGSLMLFNCI
ncbi:hypothetical protein Tco_1563389 [Tanacetum coccineum]